jgi:voltage-gated potassium channel
MDGRKLRYSLMMLAALVAFGTIGYYFFERMSVFDAFYMAIITISTVGFSEIVPLTKNGSNYYGGDYRPGNQCRNLHD